MYHTDQLNTYMTFTFWYTYPSSIKKSFWRYWFCYLSVFTHKVIARFTAIMAIISRWKLKRKAKFENQALQVHTNFLLLKHLRRYPTCTFCTLIFFHETWKACVSLNSLFFNQNTLYCTFTLCNLQCKSTCMFWQRKSLKYTLSSQKVYAKSRA